MSSRNALQISRLARGDRGGVRRGWGRRVGRRRRALVGVGLDHERLRERRRGRRIQDAGDLERLVVLLERLQGSLRVLAEIRRYRRRVIPEAFSLSCKSLTSCPRLPTSIMFAPSDGLSVISSPQLQVFHGGPIPSSEDRASTASVQRRGWSLPPARWRPGAPPTTDHAGGSASWLALGELTASHWRGSTAAPHLDDSHGRGRPNQRGWVGPSGPGRARTI